MKKLVSHNPHPSNTSLFDRLISGGAFDLREGSDIDKGLTELP